MPQPARLVTTIAAPVPFAAAGAAPFLVSRSATRRLVQRGDTELIVQDVDPSAASAATSASSVRFPAPWPRRYGQGAVSPAGDLAVFTGPHAVQAVDRTGNVQWELRHPCLAGCAGHDAFAEYANERDHRYTGSGSVGFSSDGTLVWAHTRDPLASDHGRGADQWLVIASADGTVLARARTDTAAEGSHHVPHRTPPRWGCRSAKGRTALR